ncbi:hypothetical protein RBB50_011492 [Rhinocladiella similis]
MTMYTFSAWGFEDMLLNPGAAQDDTLPLSAFQVLHAEEHADALLATANENAFSHWAPYPLYPEEHPFLSNQALLNVDDDDDDAHVDLDGLTLIQPNKSSSPFTHHYNQDLGVGDGTRDPPIALHITGSSGELTSQPTGSGYKADHLEVATRASPDQAQSLHSPTRYRRKQNRACDPCRAAKRACRLPGNIEMHDGRPSGPCSMCVIRSVECTVEWLSSRRSAPRRDKTRTTVRNYIVAPVENGGIVTENDDGGEGAVAAVAATMKVYTSAEEDLMRLLTAHDVSSRQFCLYIDIFDMPITACISQGVLPPCFSLGAAALTPSSKDQHLSPFLDLARSWLHSIWESTPTSTTWDSTAFAPHLFLIVSVLDAIFHPECSPPYSAPASPRNVSVNETYKWVAMAAAAQFSLSQGRRHDGLLSSTLAWDVACTTWRKAKQMVFENLAETSSFRVSLSLVLFGQILPPMSPEHSATNGEDAAYTRCKGIRRLQKLCVQARTMLSGCYESTINRHSNNINPTVGRKGLVTPAIPSKSVPLVLELVGAVEWMVAIKNAVTIGASKGKILPLPPDIPILPADDVADVPPSMDTLHYPSDDRSLLLRQSDRLLHDSILARAWTENKAVMDLWNPGTPEDLIVQAVHRAGALVVLLWQALASLTVAFKSTPWKETRYEDICDQCTVGLKLILLWRAAFGRFKNTTKSLLQVARPSLRRYLYYCSIDGDLACLLFYETARKLEFHLEGRPATVGKDRLLHTLRSNMPCYKEQRLTSALQVSFLAAFYHGSSSQGFEERSILKTYIHDVAAHPDPNMVFQAHVLAIEALSDEMCNSVVDLDITTATGMTQSIESCLHGLKGLKENLVMCPAVSREVGKGVVGYQLLSS